MSAFTFLFVPGAGGRAWYWHLLTPYMREHGHEAVRQQVRVASLVLVNAMIPKPGETPGEWGQHSPR